MKISQLKFKRVYPQIMLLQYFMYYYLRLITLPVLYFIFRCLGQVSLACGFIIVEALTIQMCKLQDASDEDQEDKSRDDKKSQKQSGHGSIGRQVVFTLIAQATISPVSKCENYAGTVSDLQFAIASFAFS